MGREIPIAQVLKVAVRFWPRKDIAEDVFKRNHAGDISSASEVSVN